MTIIFYLSLILYETFIIMVHLRDKLLSLVFYSFIFLSWSAIDKLVSIIIYSDIFVLNFLHNLSSFFLLSVYTYKKRSVGKIFYFRKVHVTLPSLSLLSWKVLWRKWWWWRCLRWLSYNDENKTQSFLISSSSFPGWYY